MQKELLQAPRSKDRAAIAVKQRQILVGTVVDCGYG